MNKELQTLRDILNRIIRSGRTQTNHPFLPTLMARTALAKERQESVSHWLPNPQEQKILEDLLCSLGELSDPHSRKSESTIKASMAISCSKLPMAEGAALGQLAQAVQRPKPAASSREVRKHSRPPLHNDARIATKRVVRKPWPAKRPPNPWSHMFNLSKAGKGQTDLTIYLDEAWPAEMEHGVVAGIVWRGSIPNTEILPMIRQHLRETDGFRDRAVEAIEQIKSLGDQVFPFIFKFRPPAGISRKLAYERMIHDALLILLGWLLPRPTQPVGVEVICEAIDSDHAEGVDQAREFRGRLAEAARNNPNLFSSWKLRRLNWRQKILGSPDRFTKEQVEHQGYMAYADLLAYLTFEDQSEQAADVAQAVDLESLPGYMSIAEHTVAILQDIPGRGVSQPAQVLEFLARNLCKPAAKPIFESLRTVVASTPGVRSALLHELDSQYQKKTKDLRILNTQFLALEQVVGPLDTSAPRKLRLLEIGLRLQRANHFGSPIELGELEKSYADLRRCALENGEADLVAHVELNLAVRASDRFQPNEARLIVEELLMEEPRLSLLSRAKAHSALGQYLSMEGRYEDARREFDLALELIGKADLSDEERAGDWDQTAIYRAFNAVDANFPEAHSQVVELIKLGGLGNEQKHQFRHHLLVRFLDSRDDLASERKKYLESAAAAVLDTHPWQLIAMYRGLFAAEMGDHEQSVRWFDEAIRIAMAQMHGATLRMIASVIATVAWLEIGDPSFQTCALEILNGTWNKSGEGETLESALPTVALKVQRIREVLVSSKKDGLVDEILGMLPFNYR